MANLSTYYPLPIVSGTTAGTFAAGDSAAHVGQANTFSQNQTLNGTNNVAPNQTAASGASIMTRDLTDARFLPLLGLSTSNTFTTGTNGVLFLGSYGPTSAGNRLYGEWVADIAANSSVQLDPALDLTTVNNWRGALFNFCPLQDNAQVTYSGNGFITNAGARRYQTTLASGANFYINPGSDPSITINSALTVAAGDTVTDDQGGSAVVLSSSTGTTITFRWINGTRNFTTGANLSVNGVGASRTVSTVTGMNGIPSGNADSILAYRGYDTGSTKGWCIWNNTTSDRAVRFIFHR